MFVSSRLTSWHTIIRGAFTLTLIWFSKGRSGDVWEQGEGKPVGGCHRSWRRVGRGLQVRVSGLWEVVFPGRPPPSPESPEHSSGILSLYKGPDCPRITDSLSSYVVQRTELLRNHGLRSSRFLYHPWLPTFIGGWMRDTVEATDL